MGESGMILVDKKRTIIHKWSYQFASKDFLMTKTADSLPAGRPRRSYTKLSERLRQFMEDGNFRDGDKLPPERALAESFGVSRSSVREAIRALAEKGLLESRHGDGTYVRVPDMEPLKTAILEAVDSEGLLFDEVMEYRKLVEPAIAELAALRRTPEQLGKLKIIACDQQRRLMAGENDGDLDARFHLTLAECTGNRVFIDTISRLNELYAGGRTPDLRDVEWREFSLSSHLRIIDALERQSPEDARKELDKHIDTIIHTHIFATTRD